MVPSGLTTPYAGGELSGIRWMRSVEHQLVGQIEPGSDGALSIMRRDDGRLSKARFQWLASVTSPPAEQLSFPDPSTFLIGVEYESSRG